MRTRQGIISGRAASFFYFKRNTDQDVFLRPSAQTLFCAHLRETLYANHTALICVKKRSMECGYTLGIVSGRAASFFYFKRNTDQDVFLRPSAQTLFCAHLRETLYANHTALICVKKRSMECGYTLSIVSGRAASFFISNGTLIRTFFCALLRITSAGICVKSEVRSSA